MDKMSAEFNNPKLAKVYENFNQFTYDEEFWLNTIENLKISHITDFGAGTGLFTCKLAKIGYNVIGIEPAKPMLEIVKNKEESRKIKWINGSY